MDRAWWKSSCGECKRPRRPGGREGAQLSTWVYTTEVQDCRVVISSASEMVSLRWQDHTQQEIPYKAVGSRKAHERI